MPHEIRIPNLGADIEDVTVAEWHVKVGQYVENGDVLADIETDKATVELQADNGGVIGAILIEASGGNVTPGDVVALLLADGESTDAISSYTTDSTGKAGVAAEQQLSLHDDASADYDLAVIGAGPGGYVAAIRAAQLGLKTVIVEREDLGGICLNWGCIPTKTLLRSAEVYENFKNAAEFGLSADSVTFDLGRVVSRSRAVAAKLKSGVKHLLTKNKVVVVKGHATLLGSGRIKVESASSADQEFNATNIILATGARTRIVPGLEPDGDLVWTYRDAMTPSMIPDSLLVVGAGAIGVEFASFFNAFGSAVTLVEMQEQILPVEDAEISELAKKSFVKQGIDVLTNSRVAHLERLDDHVIATLETAGEKREQRFDRVISAIGVVGNHEELGLENTAAQVDGPYVRVDEWGRTGEPGVFAIGDLAGAPCLAHKASHEGITCVEYIAGISDIHPVDREGIPGCTYSRPQVASVGLTEKGARGAGHEIRIGHFPFQANGKAIALGETEGMVKVIYDAATGELLGAHMIGAEVTELVQGFGIARTLETTEQELMHTVFPHPTLSEMMHEATLDAFDRVIHY